MSPGMAKAFKHCKYFSSYVTVFGKCPSLLTLAIKTPWGWIPNCHSIAAPHNDYIGEMKLKTLQLWEWTKTERNQTKIHCLANYQTDISKSLSCVWHGLWPARLLHPWDSPGKNTGVGCHFLLQGIFPTQGSNPRLPHCRQTLPPDPPGEPLLETSVKVSMCLFWVEPCASRQVCWRPNSP